MYSDNAYLTAKISKLAGASDPMHFIGSLASSSCLVFSPTAHMYYYKGNAPKSSVQLLDSISGDDRLGDDVITVPPDRSTEMRDRAVHRRRHKVSTSSTETLLCGGVPFSTSASFLKCCSYILSPSLVVSNAYLSRVALIFFVGFCNLQSTN